MRFATSLTNDLDGTVDQNENLAVIGSYDSGSFTVDGVPSNATMFLFDGSNAGGVQLQGFIALGTFELGEFDASNLAIGADITFQI